MKLIKIMLYLLLGLLALVSLFIIISAFHPDFSNHVAKLLYSPEKEEIKETSAVIDEEFPENDQVYTSDELLRNITNTGNSYVPPERTGIEVPAELSDKSGYVPIQESSEQVGDEEAEKLEQELTFGDTGADLTFDVEFYPYYGMLDTSEQKLYRQIYANATALNGIFTPVEQVTPRQLINIFMAVFNDHPEIFWLDSAYRGRFTRNGNCVEISLQFNETADNLAASKAAFDHAAQEIISAAQTQDSDFNKEVYVHNTLLNKIEYHKNSPLNQNAYSALVNNRTVCAGYARAFQYIMMNLGIPTYYCTGYAGESHAWNIIKLEGEFYNVDTTWDDTDPNTYDYFNRTDADFAGTHMREDLSVCLPPCNGQKYAGPKQEEGQAVNSNSGNPVIGLRSLDDVGFSSADVLMNMDDYYNNCYEAVILAGGSVQFQNVVASNDLWEQCYDAYVSGSFGDAYMNRVMEELGASGSVVEVQAELLQGGEILLSHWADIYF